MLLAHAVSSTLFGFRACYNLLPRFFLDAPCTRSRVYSFFCCTPSPHLTCTSIYILLARPPARRSLSLPPSLSPPHIHPYLSLARSLARSALAPPARSLWGKTAVAASRAVCVFLCFSLSLSLSLSLARSLSELLQVEQALSLLVYTIC
jgi:hypothetical protein